jgi:hypothetical protein
MQKGNSNNVPMPPGPGFWVVMMKNNQKWAGEALGSFDNGFSLRLGDGRVGIIMADDISSMWEMLTPDQTEKKE